ncbi:hypothetical protein KIW84_073145 [Lathyrus oleraceus]|uniref:Uncharacterized protein n=1 Tax=Pisum sativum TaxID=3888 RepID=A0A9D4ZW67_PEA|nr:hypothetical protein KIW84_073145 [Pisum sativum]
MNGSNEFLNSLPIHNSKNWNGWSKLMKSLFSFHETLEMVTNSVPELADNAIIALKAQAWIKHGGLEKFKGKKDKTQSKKSWSNPQKHKIDDRASESSKIGEGNSNQKDMEKKDWNSGDPINKPLMSYGIDEEIDKVEVQANVDIPVKVVADIPDITEVEEGMSSTS